MDFALFIRSAQYQSRTGFLNPSVTFCAISDAVTTHKTLAVELQTLPRSGGCVETIGLNVGSLIGRSIAGFNLMPPAAVISDYDSILRMLFKAP